MPHYRILKVVDAALPHSKSGGAATAFLKVAVPQSHHVSVPKYQGV